MDDVTARNDRTVLYTTATTVTVRLNGLDLHVPIKIDYPVPVQSLRSMYGVYVTLWESKRG